MTSIQTKSEATNGNIVVIYDRISEETRSLLNRSAQRVREFAQGQKDSLKELDRMTNCAQEILKKLNLPYRVILLSSGDMGFSA